VKLFIVRTVPLSGVQDIPLIPFQISLGQVMLQAQVQSPQGVPMPHKKEDKKKPKKSKKKKKGKKTARAY